MVLHSLRHSRSFNPIDEAKPRPRIRWLKAGRRFVLSSTKKPTASDSRVFIPNGRARAFRSNVICDPTL
jgi:hypothetical protein